MKYKNDLEKKNGHLRKRLNVFTREQSETKTVEAEISASLCCTTHNSFNTTPNATKLILNEQGFYSYKIRKLCPHNEGDMNFQSELSLDKILLRQYILKS